MRLPIPFKNSVSLLFILLVYTTAAFSQTNKNGADTILSRAESAYTKDPKKAIDLGRQAYYFYSKNELPVKAAKTLYALSYFCLGTKDLEQAHGYAQNGLKIAAENHVDSLAGDLLMLDGAISHYQNDYRRAIKYYRAAIPYYRVNKLEKRIGNTEVDIGICEMKLSDFETANIDLFRSSAIFQRLKDTADLASAYNSLGACFTELSSYQKAVSYYRLAYNLRLKLKDNNMIAQSLNNLGFAFTKTGQPDSAIRYLSGCLAMRSHEKDTSILVLTLQNLGSAWKVKGELDKALKFNFRALSIAKNYHMNEDMANGFLIVAGMDIIQKKFTEADAMIRKSQQASKGLNILSLLADTYAVQAELFKSKGDYKLALNYSDKKDKIKDSLFTLAKEKAVNELEIKYQTDQKEKDIVTLHLRGALEDKILNEQRLFIVVLIVAALLLMLLLVISYKSFKLKNRDNLRIQTLMKELHHRVKNNLQILSSLFAMQIDELNDEKTKNTLRENESRLLSMNFIHSKLYQDNSTSKIGMKDYLTRLLYHVKDSFGGDGKRIIDLNINIPDLDLEADQAVAVGLIVNELATNAFKYAFNENDGKIHLELNKSKQKLTLIVNDNGKGFSNETFATTRSFGLKLVNLMVRQLGATITLKNENGSKIYYRNPLLNK